MNIYVSNLSPEATREELKKAFAAHGDVASVTILTERMSGGRRTGRSRGIGFVAMPDNVGARAAIAALNSREFHGRSLLVKEARPARISRHRR